LIDALDLNAATRRGILVTNVPNDWCQNEVADHAMALLLAAARKICVYDRATRAGEWRWQSGEPIHRMQGRALGLLSFGMRVIAHDPYMAPEDVTAHGAMPVSFGELIEHSDYLVIQAPLTKETHHRIDEAELRRMKPTLILINTARGPIVNDAALHLALKAGSPAPTWTTSRRNPPNSGNWKPESPLFNLDNVVITPRAAYYSEEAIRTVRDFAAHEVVRVLTGKPPLSPVNAAQLAMVQPRYPA
jgi:D-3-phosphoglycerate dehydrogenase / 2-oxoglutarate reductase